MEVIAPVDLRSLFGQSLNTSISDTSHLGLSMNRNYNEKGSDNIPYGIRHSLDSSSSKSFNRQRESFRDISSFSLACSPSEGPAAGVPKIGRLGQRGSGRLYKPL